jgi:hypothetical protein
MQILLPALLLWGCGGEQSQPVAPAPATVQEAPAAVPTPPPAAPAPAAAPAGNAPPRIDSVKLTPGVILPGTTIKAEVAASDPDGDLVSFEYEWRRNDQVISGAVLDELDTTGFRKGELVTVTVIPADGRQKGEAKRSLPVVILNRPPEITSAPLAAIAGGKYVYEAKAEDPDGDRLAWSLEAAPEGMAIDAASGRVEWSVPAELTGSFPVRVVVTDGDARAFQGFSITLKKEPERRPE